MNAVPQDVEYLPLPLISVIVVAHNRKKFLVRALDSVLMQKNGNYTVEIIVVKNFEDLEIDSFIAEKGIINIHSKYENLGGKLAEGIENSKGKVITLLEDDDYFLDGKLNKVAEVFSTNSDLAYFHNSAEEVSEDGSVTGRIMMSAGEDLTFRGHMTFGQLMMLLKRGAHGNNSCISLSRELALILSHRLTSLNVTCDGFILLSASALNKVLKFSKEAFTAYTVHESFTHLRIKSFEDYVNSNASKASVMYGDKRAGQVVLGKETLDKSVLLAADFIELKERLNLNLFSDLRLISMRDVSRYLYLSLIGKRYSGIAGSLIHAFSLISKRAARRLAYTFNQSTIV